MTEQEARELFAIKADDPGITYNPSEKKKRDCWKTMSRKAFVHAVLSVANRGCSCKTRLSKGVYPSFPYCARCGGIIKVEGK